MIYTTPTYKGAYEKASPAAKAKAQAAIEKKLLELAARDNKFLTDCGIEAVKFDAEVGLDGIRVVILP